MILRILAYFALTFVFFSGSVAVGNSEQKYDSGDFYTESCDDTQSGYYDEICDDGGWAEPIIFVRSPINGDMVEMNIIAEFEKWAVYQVSPSTPPPNDQLCNIHPQLCFVPRPPREPNPDRRIVE